MTKIVYVSDSEQQSRDFIDNLVSDLRELGIENMEHDRERNFIVVGDIEVVGISIYENRICLKANNAEYFIDGIDIKKHKDISKERLDGLIWHIKEIMTHFNKGATQINDKDELIKILMKNNAEKTIK